MRKIEVVPYNPIWTEEFKKSKKFYEELLSGLEIIVEHVGSTSIIGLSAKPILDIDIIVEDERTRLSVIQKLESI